MAPTPNNQNGILPRNNRDRPTSRSNASATAASAINMNHDPSSMHSIDHRRSSALDHTEDPAGSAQPTPLFERLVTEEVQELKSYVRIVENQNRRLAELERVHGDLEVRLETESRIRQKLETTLEAREKEWAEKFAHVASDRDYWKKMNEEEKRKNARLLEQVVRKDQDIHRMLQRKYDHESGRSVRNVRQALSQERNERIPGQSSTASASRSPDLRHENAHKGPHQILAATGSAEKVRVRNANSLLMDFFGM